MSYYTVQNPLNFGVKSTLYYDKIEPIIIYASFEYTLSGEFRINPINLKQGVGQFQVTIPGGATQSIEFILEPGHSKVIGMISFGGNYSVEQPSPTRFRWNLTGLSGAPYFGTLSLMIE
jgi:hypothetical protein